MASRTPAAVVDTALTARAQAKHVRVTPMKARRLVDVIRGMQADEALAVLKFAPQSASEPVYKVVASAVANARFTAERDSRRLDVGDLVVSEAYVDEGPTLKRFRPRAQGRAFRVRKRTSHITVVVGAPEDGVKATKAPVTGAARRPAAKSTAKKATATKATATKTAATSAASKGRNS